jgi:hypothetical protein
VESEVWERVLRVEAENAMVLASAHEVVEGLVWKVTILEGPKRYPRGIFAGCPPWCLMV